MKLFLQIVFAFLFIVGLFFLLGYVLKEQRNINEIAVNAPIETCWNVYTDESRLSEWMDGFVSADLIEGLPGAVGSKQRMIMSSVEGSKISNTGSELFRTITKVSKPNAFSYDYTNALMDGTSEITFLTKDSITTIKSVDVFRGKKLWLRSVMFLMKSSINTKTQDQFDKLKLIIENDHQAKLKNEAELRSESEIEID